MQICFPHWTPSRLKPKFVHDVAWSSFHPDEQITNLFPCLQILAPSPHFFQTQLPVVFVLLADHMPLFSRCEILAICNFTPKSGFCTSGRSHAFVFQEQLLPHTPYSAPHFKTLNKFNIYCNTTSYHCWPFIPICTVYVLTNTCIKLNNFNV